MAFYYGKTDCNLDKSVSLILYLLLALSIIEMLYYGYIIIQLSLKWTEIYMNIEKHLILIYLLNYI